LTTATGRPEGTLTDYLREAVRVNPDGAAVRARGQMTTYAELDRASDAVAGVLLDGSTDSVGRVAIWLNKSVEAVTAIHAVLRSGGAYVPVDPTAPPLRAAAVLAAGAPSWLVTTAERLQSLQASAPEVLSALRCIVVGSGPAPPETASWSEIVTRTPAPVTVSPGPDDLAYILFTSGSTGSPKGVALTHRNARVFVDWARAEFALTPVDVLASHAPLHFDLSILDVFGAAAAAACVALVPESWQGLGAALTRFVHDEGVSVWYSVPSALRRIADSPQAGTLTTSRLRVVAFAGEEYPVRHLAALWDSLDPQVRLYNLYGPTETNVCTFHRVTKADLGEGVTSAPPIGMPCPYATTFLLDPSTEPGSGETVGELCVAGDSVMRGYWNDVVSSDAALIERADGRYYRTGDVVRRRSDGSYVFLRRRDNLVKVKGHRIELEEIEAVLDGAAEVREAVCVVTVDTTGETLITACVVPTDARPVDVRRLRRHCRNYLPTYMVPERIVVVPALLYTSTGKVDRRALSEFAERRTEADAVPSAGGHP
jgi:L-proline---[L-prolyl-carrier protein] ligase